MLPGFVPMALAWPIHPVRVANGRWPACMPERLAKRLLVASGVVAILIALVFAVMLSAIGDVRAAGHEARAAQATMASANALAALVFSLETSSRGYVITSQEPFLEPWTRAVAELPARTAELSRLASGEPDLHGTERALAGTIASYVRDYSTPLVATVRSDPAAARTTVSAGEGNRRLEVIRGQLATLIAGATAEARSSRRGRGRPARWPRAPASPGSWARRS